MQIDWLTVAAQIVNFLVLVWLLKRFLYRPVMDAMARREGRIAARLAEAARREEDAAGRALEYREKSEAFERERKQKLEKAREAAEQEKRGLLSAARNEVDEQRDKWREEVQREYYELRKTLEREMIVSSVETARRALAELANVALEDRVVALFLERLASLSKKEREAFLDGSKALRVASSFELDAKTRERLRDELSPEADIEYVHDERLICGIAVTGRGHKLEWNFASFLGNLESRIEQLLSTPAVDRLRA
jgi:F-type H+-transporting ATPase subunit b